MLTIRCTLLRDTFEGGQALDPTTAEWPPSWMRLFSALVSVAEPGTDDEVLVRLEAERPPRIVASESFLASYREAYVATNALGETRHATMVGRTNGLRGWARAVPKHPCIWYQWPELDLSTDERSGLARLCRRVPYLGRSTSPATLDLVEEPDTGGDLKDLGPAARAKERAQFAFAQQVRCPFPGALGVLRETYDTRDVRTTNVYEIGTDIDYGVERLDEPSIATGPYRSMVMFELLSAGLDGRHTARATHAFRRTILSRADRHVPTLHGHHDGSVVQCAFVGLPFVDEDHADGHLLGLALCIPELEDDELSVIARALGAPGGDLEIAAGPLGVLRLRRVAPLDAARPRAALQPRRWTRPSRTWVSALPVVLDRYPRRRDELEAEVQRAVVNARLPEPNAISTSRWPMLPGALELRPHDTLRRPTDRNFKPYCHAVIEFPVKVEGPVLVGSMRHYGLGLFAPWHPGDEDD